MSSKVIHSCDICENEGEIKCCHYCQKDICPNCMNNHIIEVHGRELELCWDFVQSRIIGVPDDHPIEIEVRHGK